MPDAPAEAKGKKPSLEGKEVALDGEAVQDAPAESKESKKSKKPKLSFYQLGKLTQALEVDLQEEHSRITNDVMDSAIANRLMELGDDAETARKNAPIVRKVYRGQEVTLTERMGIAWNKNASQVARELASTIQEGDEGRVGKSWQTAMGVVAEKATAPVRDMKAQLREALTNKKSHLNTAINEAKSKAAKVSKHGKNLTSKMVTIADGESGTESQGEFRRFKKHGKIMEMVIFSEGAEKTVSVEDMTQAEGAGMAEIIEYVAGGGTHIMSETEANTLASVYQSVGGDAGRVIRGYEMVYLSGYSGLDMPVSVLPDAAAQAVYDAAKAEAEADEKNRVARTKAARKAGKGLVTFLGKVTKDSEVTGAGSEVALSEAMEGMTESQKLTVEAVEEFSRQFKINTVLFESEGEGVSTMQNGSYDASTHTVYIDVNSGANSTEDIKQARKHGTLGYAMMRTLGHEVTHAIEATSASGYAAYKAAVKEKLGKDWSRLVQEKLGNALNRGQKLTLQGAEAEVVADASEYMLQDSKFVETIDKSVRGRVKAVISDFVERVRGIFNKLAGGHRESRALRRMEGNVYHYLDNLQQLWDVAAEEMVAKGEMAAFDETESYDVPITEAEATETTPRKSKQLPRIPVDELDWTAPLSAREQTDMTVTGTQYEDDYRYVREALNAGGRKIGYAGLLVDENEVYLERIDVEEDERNKGYGTEFLRKIAEKYGEFYTAPDNEDAKRLYERLGTEVYDHDMYDQGYGVYLIEPWEEDISYSYAGRRSETANKSLLQEAQEMEFDDADPEAIRQATGWFRGMDGQWRYEIDDSQATYKTTTAVGATKLKHIYSHPVLFEAYPELAETPVEVTEELPDGANAGTQGKKILLNANRFADDAGKLVWSEKNKSTLQHEIQHLIQEEEGFAGGSSVGYWADKLYPPRKNDRLIKRLNKQIDELYNAHTEEEWSLLMQHEDAELAWANLSMDADPAEEERLLRNLDRLTKELNAKVPGLLEAYRPLSTHLRAAIRANREMTAQELYQKTAGEIEARDAAERRGLTKEQRRATLPALDEDAVFAEDVSWPVQFSAREADQLEEDKYYSRTIDKWDGKASGGRMKVGSIKENSIYTAVGLPAGELYFDYSKAAAALSKHGDHLTKEMLKQIPAMLASPVVITEPINQQVKNTINVFGEMMGDNGKPIMVSILMRPDVSGNYLLNVVRTVEMRSDTQKLITPDTLLYVDTNKKRVRDWFLRLGNSSVPFAVNQYGLIRSISYSDDSVNSKIQHSTRDASADGELYTRAGTEYNAERAKNSEYGIDWQAAWTRWTDSTDGMSRAGYAMFSRQASIAQEAERGSRSGKTLYIYYGKDAVYADSERFQGLLKSALDNEMGKKRPSAPDELLEAYEENPEDTLALFDPQDIVMSAEAYDNEEWVEWLSEWVLAPNDINAIITADGALVFDERLFEKHAGISKEDAARDAAEYTEKLSPEDAALDGLRYYSFRDLPTDAISIREYLGSMEPTDRMTETERDLLGRYQAHLKTLGEKEAAIAEQEEIIRTVPLRNEDGTINAELQKAKNRIRLLREQAARETRALNAAESSKGFARLMATSRQVVDTYLLGASGSVADAADALDAEVDALTKRLKTLAEDITRTAEGQKAAFARGLYDQKQLNAAAKSLKDAYGSRMSVSAIADRLALCFGELYANPGSAEAAKKFVEDARELAEDILQGHKYRYKSEVLPLLKEYLPAISLSTTDLSEIRNAGLTLTEYKRMLSPYVGVSEGSSDLSSMINGQLAYGDGTLAAILGEDVEGNLAMRLYEVISNEKAKEAEIGTEGMSEGDMIIAVMADIAGATLPGSEDGKTIEYLRKELQKHAGESVAAAQLVDEAIAGARKVTGRATRVWAEAARNSQTAKAAVEYYRKLEEQRRLTELREQKRDITEQLRSEYAKRLEEKVQKQRDEHRQRERNAVDYRRARDEVNKLRRKIGRDVKRLNALRMRETDMKHVPQELQYAVDELLLTFTDNAIANIAFADKQIARLSYAYQALRELERDESHYWDDEIDSMFRHLSALADDYNVLKVTSEGDIRPSNSLEMLEKEQEILQGIDDAVSHVKKLVDDTNAAFLKNRTEPFNEYAAMTGMELLKKKDFRQLRGGFGEAQRALDEWLRTGNMTPVYFMEHLQSPMLQEIFDEVRNGQTRYARIVAEGKAFVQEAKEKYHYGSWVADGTLKLKTGQGHMIELTREEAAELYAIAKRERTNRLYQTEHLIGGGFQFKDVLKKKGKGLQAAEKTTHQLDTADIARIENWLTDEQRAYADALVGFLSTTMADYGNEAAMAMFGYKKFTESYYIPFKTAAEQRFLRGDEGPEGEDAGTGRVKNSGFTKKLQHKANATLVVGGITDTVTEHIHKMATYAALVEPIENMKRMLNYKMVDKDGTTNTIRALIGKKYGQASENYMTQLLKDLNGAAQGDERATKGINWLIGAFKRGAVMASASVVLQQPTAIARAMAYIPVKHFGQNPFYRPSKGTWDEMMKYSGTAVIKDMGKFDVGMGLTASQYMADEHLNPVEAYRRLKAESRWEAGKAGFKSFMDWLTAAPGVADQWTWGMIWKANKAYQAEQHPEMDHNSEAFLELCGSTFDNVIDHSQVYDSVLTRSDLMRSKNAIHKMATSFMAEPTMSINMLYDAVTGAWKKKYTRRHAGAIIGSVMASQVLAGAMAALVQAWNDDKDKRNWLEKYADAATGNILSNINPFGMIPYVSEVISLMQGYDVERADMSVFSTLITQTANFWGKVSKGESLTWKDWENFAGNWANLTGVPVKNIMREIRRTINAVGNTQWTAPDGFNVAQAMLENVPLYDSKNKTYYERIVAADLSGDTQLATDYREYMLLSKMVTEDALKSGLKSAMKEQVIAGKADAQTAIDYLVKIGAAEDADEAYWEVDKWEYMKETGNKADTYRKCDDFIAAVRTGENLKQVIQTYLDNGVSKETLAGQITSAFKAEYVDLYNAGKRSDASVLQSRLLTAYVALGYDRDKKLKDIQKWLESED